MVPTRSVLYKHIAIRGTFSSCMCSNVFGRQLLAHRTTDRDSKNFVFLDRQYSCESHCPGLGIFYRCNNASQGQFYCSEHLSHCLFMFLWPRLDRWHCFNRKYHFTGGNSYLASTFQIAVFAGPIIAVLFSVFGFCIRYMDTPIGFRWIFHISYFRAGFHSLLYTVYGFGRKDLSCDDIYCHYQKPKIFLKEMEISDTNVVNNFVLIVVMGVLMHLLTASALWCKLNRR